MLTWFLNPWMLLGGLAVASPVLIHLLNKRRFKIVEWAAMDFLFEADKKNRRRVQLENFILLLLRCLAMLLVALLLARPFLPSSLTSVLQNTQKFERLVVIDDSLSQRVLNGTQPAIETAKKSVLALMSRLANSNQSEDWLTLFLTSRPDQPLLVNEPLTANTLSALNEAVERIECADQVADYAATLNGLRRSLSGQQDNVGRVAYVYTDLRQRDWLDGDATESENAPNQILNAIADELLGCFLIDIGSNADNNLAIVDVRPESLQVADKVIRFDVQVVNHGVRTVSDVRVSLQVDEGQPLYETLPSIAPDQTVMVGFRHYFSAADDSQNLLTGDTETVPAFKNYRIRAEIDRQSLGDSGLENDQLLEDSSGLFAARVMNGVSVLLVDGDPSAASERSETHYLRALDVAGTGLIAETVTVSELETVSLSQYQAIFLCNVDEASPDRIASLEHWVNDGGSLVLMPGNRVRAEVFNHSFHREGRGLSPLSLTAIAGDPTMSQWVNFEIDPQIHPALQVIVNSDATSLSHVDIFSWWKSQLDATQVGRSVVVPLRLNDQDNSAAMVERTWGQGKVVVFTIPGDGDWTMWPSSPTFAPVMIDLIDYLVGSEADAASLKIGGAITYPVDLSVYESRVTLRDPQNEKTETVARPGGADAKSTTINASSDDSPADSTLYQARFDHINRRGFYSLELKRHTGEVEPVLFAANYDPRESQLRRLSAANLEGDFFSDQVARISANQLADQQVSGGNSEIWMQLLIGLFGVLIVEQFLGWYWGRRR